MKRHTNYLCQSNDREIKKNGIPIISDWAQDATLDAGEIDKERGNILKEKRLGKGVSERLQRQYHPLFLAGKQLVVSPYM